MSDAAKAVHPRDAASLVIVCRDPGATRVLMGRRAPKNRFMPDVFVFPGGGVQRDDATRACISELGPKARARLEELSTAHRARGLAVAAARETHEETGLEFGRLVEGALQPDLAALDFFFRAITPPESPIRFHARFFVASAERARGVLRSNGELLDLAWFCLDEARELPIIDVTEDVLSELERRERGEASPRVPLFHYRNGKRQVRR